MAAAHNKHRPHRTIKLGLKLAVFSLLVLGASMVFGGGGKVMAASACPADIGQAGFQEANALNWGVPVTAGGGGPDGGNMAGLVIQAYDASDNSPVNLKYTLNSGVTGAGDDERHVAANPPNPAYDYNYNARIFNATTGSDGGTDFSARHSGLQSGTDSILYDGQTGIWQCNGWDAFGPSSANTSMHGNGYVLDCGPLVPGPSGSVKQYSQFWFTSLSPQAYNDYDKNGQNIGQNGYWSVDITNSTGGNIHINNWDGSQMGFNGSKVNNTGAYSFNNQGSSGPLEFNVVNGTNTYVQFIWHPQPIVHTTPPASDGSGACENLTVDEDVGTGNKTRVWVTASGEQYGKLAFRSPKDSTSPSWYPGPTGNDHYNPRLDFNNPDGTNPGGQWVGPGGAGGDTGGGSYSKEWWFEPDSNSVTITYRQDNLPQTWDPSANGGTGGYNYKNSSWNNGTTQYLQRNGDGSFGWTSSPASIDCFAGCTTALSADGDLAESKIEAGGPMHISGTFKNTGVLPLWYPAVLGPDGNYYPVQISGSTLNPGDSAPFSFTITAPNQVEYDTLSISSSYYGALDNPSSCNASATVPIYQWFQSNLTPSSTPKPNTEHPTQGDDYYTQISVQNASSQSVYIPTSSSFYKLAAAGGTTTYNSASNSGGPPSPAYASSPAYPGATTTTLSGHIDLPDGSYVAGDEFCAHIHADYTTGYVGPDSTVVGAGNPQDANSCPRIANEPYFKVLNSDVNAGGDFDACTSSGGMLAGYNDNSDPAGVDRGASSQLSDLALIKITGVASAQTPGNPGILRSPTDLTFANTNPSDITADSQSPGLGGNFSGCGQLTNESAPASATAIGASTPANRATGSYTRTGNLQITGGNLAAGNQVSIFVKGNVYISNNITYNQSTGWSAGNVPSFIVHATGNIYIKPSVTSLAGLYIAQSSGGSGGKIYDCAGSTGYSPMAAHDLYTCNNQLVVYGSFIADQVNLMRTYGSLRDEIPNPAVGAVAPTAGSPQISLFWGSAGPAPGYYCVHIDEPSDSHTWDDNYLCEQPGYNVALAWTHYANNPSPSGNPADGWDTVADLQAKGYTDCTYWWVPADPDTWTDNALCANKNIGLTFSASNLSSSTENCTNINESADPDANWSHGGYWLCAQYSAGSAGSLGSPPTAKGPPYNSCSNQGAEADNKSCAGEVFEFSPQMYLAGGGIVCPGGGCGGPLQYQALNSLPPVL